MSKAWVKKLLLLVAALTFSSVGFGQTVASIHGDCAQGNTLTITQGLNSVTRMMVSYPQCTVTVHVHGAGLATLFSNSSLAPLSNPFTATTNGSFVFYAAVGTRYDVTLSGGQGTNNIGSTGFPSPYTISDIYLQANGVVTACVPVINATDVLVSDGTGGCTGDDDLSYSSAIAPYHSLQLGSMNEHAIFDVYDSVGLSGAVDSNGGLDIYGHTGMSWASRESLGVSISQNNSMYSPAIGNNDLGSLDVNFTVTNDLQGHAPHETTVLDVRGGTSSGTTDNEHWVVAIQGTTRSGGAAGVTNEQVNFNSNPVPPGEYAGTADIGYAGTAWSDGTTPISGSSSAKEWALVMAQGKSFFQDIILQPEMSPSASVALFGPFGAASSMVEVTCNAAQRGRVHYKNTTPDVVEVCENTSGVTYAWVALGGAGDTVTSPNSTLNVGGTATNTTLDLKGAAGKIMAGSTPALTYTPVLGVPGSNAGTLGLANGAAAFTTTLGTKATANYTFNFPTTAGTNLYGLITDGSGNTSFAALGAAQTCTNKLLSAIDAAGTAGNCKTVTSSYIDTSIARTGGDLDTSTPTKVLTVNGNSVAQIIYNRTSTAQVAAITTTNMHTVTNSGAWRFSGDINCTTSSAAATATLTLSWTDTSNTAQTQTVTATCTTLGAASLGQITYSFRAKSGTNISYAVSIANTPTFDVDVALETINGVL